MIDIDAEIGASVVPHLAHDRLVAAMREVESLPPPARGALLVEAQDEPLGTILIDANRVCWSAALGMGGRLRDILRSYCNDAAREDELEDVYFRCRRDSQPLGRVLTETGLVSPEHLRAAIKQHTIESLLALDAAVASLCGAHARQWPMRWIDHSGCGYNPRYTFGAVEVLEAAGAERLDRTEAELMLDHLDALDEPRNAVVAFSFQPDGTPLFLGPETALSIDVQDLVDLTAWAEAALGASPGFSPEVAHACARSANGGVVAWRYQGHCCAAICVGGESLQRLTASLGNQSLAMVLGTRAAVLDRVRRRTNVMKQGE